MSRLLPRQSTLLPVLALLLGLTWQSTAEARRGVILITSGDTIKHVSDLAEEARLLVRSVTGSTTSYKLGYLHDRIGVFWIDLWTWGGEYVLYDETEQDLWSLDDDQAAALLGLATEDLPKPTFYSYPPGLLALGAVGIVCVVMQSFAGKPEPSSNKQAEQLLADPRYQRAMETLINHYNKKAAALQEESESGYVSTEPQEDDTAVFDKVVRELVAQGIPYNDAYCNLNLLLEEACAPA